MENSAMFTRNSNEWTTPENVIDRVIRLGPIILDPCWCFGAITKPIIKMTKQDNALRFEDWAAQVHAHAENEGVTFVNPPYADVWELVEEFEDGSQVVCDSTKKKDLKDTLASWADERKGYIQKITSIPWWIERCYTTSQKMATYSRIPHHVLTLVPARVDTKWGHFCFDTAQAICFIRGRLKFSNAKNCAPFPSMLVYWGPRPDSFYEAFKGMGRVVDPAVIPMPHEMAE